MLLAVKSWVGHDKEQRKKFAKVLLSKVNFFSLPSGSQIINSILIQISPKLQVEIAEKMRKAHQKKPKSTVSYRRCAQNLFDVMLSGGILDDFNRTFKVQNRVIKINGKNLKDVKVLARMQTERYWHKTVYCQGEVYVIGGRDKNRQKTLLVEKYSLTKNKWQKITYVEDAQKGFSVCAFMSGIYLLGGLNEVSEVIDSCMCFNTKNNYWTTITEMNNARVKAACTVFEGKIVISGGLNQDRRRSNTVESYDYFANTWSSMPNMVKGRHSHCLVTNKNKMFVCGYGEVLEVFDSTNNKFDKLNLSYMDTEGFAVSGLFSMGNKVYSLSQKKLSSYDVEKKELSEEIFESMKNIYWFSCTAIPQLELSDKV